MQVTPSENAPATKPPPPPMPPVEPADPDGYAGRLLASKRNARKKKGDES